MKRLAIISPAYNEEDALPVFFQAIDTTARALADWEFDLFIVNDGSSDHSLEVMLQEQRFRTNLFVVNLSRNFGQEAAIAAGLAAAVAENRHDAFVVVDCDLQDPLELIPKMIDLHNQGYDVVQAKREKRLDSVMKQHSAWLFYKLQSLLADPRYMPEANVGHFRLISRRVAIHYLSMAENTKLFKSLIPFIGFKTATISFVRPERRTGSTKYNFHALLRVARENLLSSSTKPLEFIMLLGCLLMTISFAWGVWMLYVAIVPGRDITFHDLELMLFLAIPGINLFCLGIIGLYVAKMYWESKGRPQFFIESLYRPGGDNLPPEMR